jgi:hypothetical protein
MKFEELQDEDMDIIMFLSTCRIRGFFQYQKYLKKAPNTIANSAKALAEVFFFFM